MTGPEQARFAQARMIDDPIAALHHAIDAATAELQASLPGRLRCAKGCASCCVDDLSVLLGEARRIVQSTGATLADAAPGPVGACVFLDHDQACRIYDARPQVCRTQGLPLRWVEEDDDGDIVDQRDICPLNADVIPLDDLDDDACWVLGVFEEQLVRAELDSGNDDLTRIPLRQLFDQLASTRP